MNDEMTAMILGRIIALEQIKVPQIIDDAARAMRSIDIDADVLIERIQASRKELIASLQNIEHTVGDFSDQVWAEMAVALNNLFDNALRRAEGFRSPPVVK